MLVAGKTVAQADTRRFGGTFDKRVVVQREDLDARITLLRQALDEFDMHIGPCVDRQKEFGDRGGHEMPVRPLDDKAVIQLIQCIFNPQASRV